MVRRQAEPFRVALADDVALDRHRSAAGHDLDRAAGAVSRAQRGAITTAQLTRLGFSRSTIRRRTRRRLLSPLLRGVHLWGGGLALPGTIETAAVLACRGRVVLGGESAGALLGICSAPYGVTVLQRTGHARSRPRLTVVRTTTLRQSEIVRYCGLPVTSPLRTLFDLAARGYPRLEAAVSEAHARGLIDAAALTSFAQTHRRLPGGGRLCRVAAAEARGFTRSENERRMRRLCREAELPQPMTDRHVAGWEVDFLWPDVGLVLEVDALNTHGSAVQFERDRRKQRQLLAAGVPVMRVTDRALHREPLPVVADLASALARLAAARAGR